MAIKEYMFIEGNRNGYTPEQCGETYTIGILAEIFQRHVEDGDGDVPVYLRNDNGYTYGSISGWDINLEDYDDGEPDDDDEDEEE